MKHITKEDIRRSIKFMVGKKLTVEQQKRLKYFWKTGNNIPQNQVVTFKYKE